MRSIENIINAFSQLDLTIIIVSLILFFAAAPTCRWFSNENHITTRISMMRLLNFLIIVALVVNNLFIEKSAWLSKVTQALIVIYFTVLLTQIINYFIRQRFGRIRNTKNTTIISDTYSSRGLSLVVTAIMFIIAVVTCLRIMGFESLLQAGGALGIIGLVLAMTQAAWAPDIISGLIILNSRFCEEGDVIQFNMADKDIIASIFKTKLFHTECLDLANNHRIMVRNERLRDYGVQNLSRFASARGLREHLLFNIDYQHSEDEVVAMIQRAFKNIDIEETIREEQYDPEVMVHDTGDYAVTWAVYYYIKDVKRVLKIRQQVRSYILAESVRSNISLATPILQQNSVTLSKDSQ